MTLPRLDILIYAHDGRGLGHASRSAAVGMALRRMFPQKRVLFVSGCKATAALIGKAPLDWIKLPSYETTVIDGVSRGAQGHSNFSHKELGRYRAAMLRELVADLRPRLVLVDHQPQGKQKELLPAIEATSDTDTRWVLGLRGIVGGVPQVLSDLSRTLFRSRFEALFWYGDSRILGSAPLTALADHFNTRPLETGYVSRMAEFLHWQPPVSADRDRLGGSVSIPWLGENTLAVLPQLAAGLDRIGDSLGPWRLFIGCKNPAEKTAVSDLFKDMAFCRVEPPSDLYPEALAHSRFAVIYGGYNSIIDILQMDISAMVLMRGMRDSEQEQHLAQLNAVADAGLAVLAEAALTAEAFEAAVLRCSATCHRKSKAINLTGAETTARRLVALLGDSDLPA